MIPPAAGVIRENLKLDPNYQSITHHASRITNHELPITNQKMSHRFIQIGAILAFLGVAGGAFGAHVLEARLDAKDLEIFKTGVFYHMIHALAILTYGLMLDRRPQAPAWPGWMFLIGIIVFSGSLYALVLSGQRWLGAITPIGGVAFLVGWAGTAVAAGRRVKEE